MLSTRNPLGLHILYLAGLIGSITATFPHNVVSLAPLVTIVEVSQVG
jgi:hypothetical protein